MQNITGKLVVLRESYALISSFFTRPKWLETGLIMAVLWWYIQNVSQIFYKGDTFICVGI